MSDIPGTPQGSTPGGATDALDSRAAGGTALRGGMLRTAAYVAGLLLALASAPILIRYLGQERFGQYGTIIALITIVFGLAEGGINALGVREYSTTRGEERRALLASMLGLRLVTSLVAGLVAVGFALVAGYDDTIVLGAALAGIGMALTVTQTFLTISLQGELRFGWVSAIEVIRQSIVVAGIVLVVVVGGDVAGFAAVLIPAGLITLLVTARLVRGMMPLRPAFAFRAHWPLLRDSITYSAAIALNSLYFRLTIIVMSLIATDLQTGYFVTSFRLVEVLIGIPALVIGAAFPIFSRTARTDMDRFLGAAARAIELSVAVGAWMVACVFLGAPFAIEVLGGAEAAPATGVLQIQGFAILGTFIALAAGFPLLALHRHRGLLIANAGALVAMVALSLILIPELDAKGAAVAGVSAEVTLVVAYLVLLRRAVPAIVLPVGAAATVVVVAAASTAVVALVPVHPAAQVVLVTGLYGLALRLAGRFPPEVREVLGARRGAAALR